MSPRLRHGLETRLLCASRLSTPKAPSGSAFTSALSCSSSTLAIWYSGCTSRDHRHVSVVATEACCVVPVHRLSVCALGSFSTGSVSIRHPHGLVKEIYIMAPPSLDSAVGHHPAPGFPLVPPILHSPINSFLCLGLFVFPFSFLHPPQKA